MNVIDLKPYGASQTMEKEEFVLSCASAVWSAAQMYGIDGLEIEYRLGRQLPGDYFAANVSKEGFEAFTKALESSTHDRKVRIQTTERCHQNMKHVSTSLIQDEHGDHAPPPSYIMSKVKLHQQDLPIEGTPYTLRFGIAVEKVLDTNKSTNSGLVRCKTRTRYIQGVWAFDLTEVTSTDDLDAEETCEIELELVSPDILYQQTMARVVEQGLAKIMYAASQLQV